MSRSALSSHALHGICTFDVLALSCLLLLLQVLLLLLVVSLLSILSSSLSLSLLLSSLVVVVVVVVVYISKDIVVVVVVAAVAVVVVVVVVSDLLKEALLEGLCGKSCVVLRCWSSCLTCLVEACVLCITCLFSPFRSSAQGPLILLLLLCVHD